MSLSISMYCLYFINIKSSGMLSTKQLASVRGYYHHFIGSGIYWRVTAGQKNMTEQFVALRRYLCELLERTG